MTMIITLMLMHISISVIIDDHFRYRSYGLKICASLIPSLISMMVLGYFYDTVYSELVEACIIAGSIILYVVGLIKLYLK